MKVLAAWTIMLFGVSSSFTSIDLLKAFHTRLPKIHRATGVPVLLPRTMPLGSREHFHVYATGGATRKGWDHGLAAAPRCGGANACFVASFVAHRGGKLPRRSNLRLSTGDKAVFQAISCGGSCSPASLWFLHGGVLYEWQFKDPPRNTRAVMARLAAAAIRAGPR
jgi:hypothetical protein